MKLAKRLMAASLAVIMAAGMAACGSSDKKDESSVAPGKDLNEEQQQLVDSLASKLPDRDLKNTTIKWMAHYDINPTEGKVMPPAIQLFKTKYDGKIEPTITTYADRYTKLATDVMAGDSPDFFPADDMDTFPRGAIRAMFQPIDDYIDLDSDLWKDSKSYCDEFLFQGKHYIAVIEPTPNYACIYNRTTIEENGFEDPAELFKNDEWDWDVFTDMCVEFTNADEDKYALDGYWYGKALSETSGVPMIGLENGQIVSNMSDPAIEKVQDRMYNLQKNGVVYPRCDNNWNTRGSGETGEGLGSYLTLFIPVGLWAIEGPPESTKLFGDIEAGEIMFVPMPKNPDADAYYVSARVNGYTICTGAPNPEGVAAYLDCVQVTNQEASSITTEVLKDEYKWTDEMLEMRETLYQMAAEHPVFDLQEGVSPEMNTVMMTVSQATMISGGNETTWTACRGEHEGEVDYLVKEANSNISATPSED